MNIAATVASDRAASAHAHSYGFLCLLHPEHDVISESGRAAVCAFLACSMSC